MVGCTVEDVRELALLLGGQQDANPAMTMSKIYDEGQADLMPKEFESRAFQAATLLCSKITEAADSGRDALVGVDGSFLLFSAYLVFFMQAGFAMLTAGSVRSKNCMNAFVKNIVDACAASLAFYCFGYGFAFGKSGDSGNWFIGSGMYALEEVTSWHIFLFQWAFAAAAATIVSGAVAERCTFHAYILYSVFLTGFVYPVVVHWVWSSDGWLSGFNEDPLWNTGMLDFAGSGVVHMIGGFAGMWGSYIIGPRQDRFDENGKPRGGFAGHSVPLVVLGTFILWLGWYGFNPGSMLMISGEANLEAVSRVAVCTTLSGSAAALSSLYCNWFFRSEYHLINMCNGLLGGLVGVTASCAVVEPWAAILCGIVAGALQFATSIMMIRLQIDDPLDAVSVHGFCGMWGVFFLGLLAKKDYIQQVYGRDDETIKGGYGVFYGGDGSLLACQCIGILVIFGWVSAMMGTFFFAMHKSGYLRIDERTECLGLDISHHGGRAYAESYQQSESSSPPQQEHSGSGKHRQMMHMVTFDEASDVKDTESHPAEHVANL